MFITENRPIYILLIAEVFIDLLHIYTRLRQLQLKVDDSAYEISTEPTLNFT